MTLLYYRHIQLTIAYDGTDYHGWQIQPGYRTVQAALCEAATTLLRHPAHVQGASRTDAGVHASGQMGWVRTSDSVQTADLPSALNAHLPKDIVVRHAEETDPALDLLKCVASKGYRYTLYTGRLCPVSRIRFCWHIPTHLSIEVMQAAAQYLVGMHDFRSFAASVDKGQNTVRTLSRCDVTRGCDGDPDVICFDVQGDGFLHHMIRVIVGTLVDISRGHWRSDQIPEILAARDRGAAGHLAPASGLCLEWIQLRNPLRNKA